MNNVWGQTPDLPDTDLAFYGTQTTVADLHPGDTYRLMRVDGQFAPVALTVKAIEPTTRMTLGGRLMRLRTTDGHSTLEGDRRRVCLVVGREETA